jgi:hypothetical protein
MRCTTPLRKYQVLQFFAERPIRGSDCTLGLDEGSPVLHVSTDPGQHEGTGFCMQCRFVLPLSVHPRSQSRFQPKLVGHPVSVPGVL